MNPLGVNDPVMVLLLRALSLVLSSAIILACVRAFIFFGGALEAQKNITKEIAALAEQAKSFAKEVRDGLMDHEKRIMVSEASLESHERRLDDSDMERRHRIRREADRGDE